MQDTKVGGRDSCNPSCCESCTTASIRCCSEAAAVAGACLLLNSAGASYAYAHSCHESDRVALLACCRESASCMGFFSSSSSSLLFQVPATLLGVDHYTFRACVHDPANSPGLQGQLEAAQRAQYDHQDASQAARMRYNELIIALRDNPQDLAQVQPCLFHSHKPRSRTAWWCALTCISLQQRPGADPTPACTGADRARSRQLDPPAQWLPGAPGTCATSHLCPACPPAGCSPAAPS